MVVHLLTTAALWVRNQTSLSSPPKKIYKKERFPVCKQTVVPTSCPVSKAPALYDTQVLTLDMYNFTKWAQQNPDLRKNIYSITPLQDTHLQCEEKKILMKFQQNNLSGVNFYKSKLCRSQLQLESEHFFHDCNLPINARALRIFLWLAMCLIFVRSLFKRKPPILHMPEIFSSSVSFFC